MSVAVATAQASDAGIPASDRHRVIIESVGKASPSSARSVAVGLGVPVQGVLEAFYKAPTVLVDGLGRETAEQMAGLLESIGCNAAVQPELEPAPAPAILHDVALYLSDTGKYGEICKALAAFVGTGEEDAAKLISTPPGVVLGTVSEATADALQARLGDGAELILSRPEKALYEVFLAETDAPLRARLMSDLRTRGFEPVAEEGCILTGLDKETADQLWAAHRAGGRLQIVNRDFLRFDIVLTGGSDTPVARTALNKVAGVPKDIVPQLFAEMPITVMEAVPSRDLEASVSTLSKAGLQLRADLVTFLHLGLQITDTDDARMTLQALNSLGLWKQSSMPKLPWRAPWHLPELQARILRDTLESAGAYVEMIDPTEEAA